MRKTIYVKDGKVWEDIKRKSAGMGLSISEYLLGAKHAPNASQLDRIEEKIDLLLGDRPPGEKISRGDMIRPDDEVIKEAQEKLENIQKSRGYFNPQPKGKK